MVEITLENMDSNSDSAVLTAIHFRRSVQVEAGEVICELETSKAVFEIKAEASGFVFLLYNMGDNVAFNQPIGYIFPTLEQLEEFKPGRQEYERPRPKKLDTTYNILATRRAQQLAERHGVDLSSIKKGALITESDVQALIGPRSDEHSVYIQTRISKGTERVLILLGGTGATQVIDILLDDPRKLVVGILDDAEHLHGKKILNVPVLGKTDKIEELFKEGLFDTAIVSSGNTVEVRKKFYDLCQRFSVPLTNAIDRTAKIGRDCSIGTGNVICAFVHFGVQTAVGNNNFISAYCSFDHHNKLGDHICTGPGCMASGHVTVESEVRMGTGIFIEPHLTIGRAAKIASGAVLRVPVPAFHSVKAKGTAHVITPTSR